MNKKAEKTIKPIALADRLGIRPQQVFGWVRNGQLPSIKVDGHHALIIGDVKTFLTERATAAEERAAKMRALIEVL